MSNKAYIQTENGGMVSLDIIDSGLVFGSSQGEARTTLTNYETTLTFETYYIASQKTWLSFVYPPRDELRNRLNDWIQGKQPATPVNTRYWRNL